MQVTTVDKNQLWQGHLDDARVFPGGVSGYCRSKQISSSNFYYWRDKLAKKPSAKTTPSPFMQVEVTRTPAPQNSLPDPRWLAELIRGLLVGGVR